VAPETGFVHRLLLVAVETPEQLKETMLGDWWQSFQQGKRVVILAYRRDEVDQFNTACQQLRDTEGQLGPERLTVRDRSFAVGPRDQSRLVAHATMRRQQHEQRLAEATTRRQDARDLVALLEHGPARWLHRGDLARARQQYEQAAQAWQVARQRADRAADRERDLRQTQQQYHAHREANPELAAEHRAVLREEAWQRRVVAGPRAAAGDGQGWPRLGSRGQAGGGVPAALEGR
jgi:hypothetical protein